MHYQYKTRGTCSSAIEFDMEDGVIRNVHYEGGCNGNLQAVSKLVDGWKTTDVVEKLKGINCGHRGTSCADQLTRAITEAEARHDA
jgi:uncharacterized protein (TIGR03905 family)